MTVVSEVDAPVAEGADDASAQPGLNPVGSVAVTALIGAALVVAAGASAVALLVAVAAVQALMAFTWVFTTSLPGRKGAVVIAGLASIGADVTVSVWPDGQLGTLLIVFALAMPAMFVHQLMRGTVRVRVVESMGGIALLLVAVTGLPALLQLRHEFPDGSEGGHIAGGVVAVAAAALIIGLFVDMIMPAPRFDPQVGRGLLAVVASAGLGGSVGHLVLRADSQFAGGRGAFIGAALGALVAFFAVAVAFVEYSLPPALSGFALRARPVLTAVLPLCLVAPVGFLLCLALRA